MTSTGHDTTYLSKLFGGGDPYASRLIPSTNHTLIHTFDPSTGLPVATWHPNSQISGTQGPFVGAIKSGLRDWDWISPEHLPDKGQTSVYTFRTIDPTTFVPGQPIYFDPPDNKTPWGPAAGTRHDNSDGRAHWIPATDANEGDYAHDGYFTTRINSKGETETVPRFPEMFKDKIGPLEGTIRDLAQQSRWAEGRSEHMIKGLASRYYDRKIETDTALRDNWTQRLQYSQNVRPADETDMARGAVNRRALSEEIRTEVAEDITAGFNEWMEGEARAAATGQRPTTQPTSPTTTQAELPAMFTSPDTTPSTAPSTFFYGTGKYDLSPDRTTIAEQNAMSNTTAQNPSLQTRYSGMPSQYGSQPNYPWQDGSMFPGQSVPQTTQQSWPTRQQQLNASFQNYLRSQRQNTGYFRQPTTTLPPQVQQYMNSYPQQYTGQQNSAFTQNPVFGRQQQTGVPPGYNAYGQGGTLFGGTQSGWGPSGYQPSSQIGTVS